MVSAEAGSTGNRTEAAPRRAEILGRIDIADAGRVSGWAWDQAQPDRRLQVQIWHGSELLGTTVANRERADLKRNGIGDGGHAFQFRLERTGRELDVGALVAKVVCPDLADPVPLFRPSETQTVVERTVLLPFARLQKTLDLIAERQLKLARAWEGLRDERETGPDQTNQLLERLLESQERVDSRLKEFEVFQARFDAALRGLSEQAEASAGNQDRALRQAVIILSGTTLLCCCTIGLLLLRPILG